MRETPPPLPRKKAFSFDDILKEFEKNLEGETYQEEEVVEEIRHENPAPVAVQEKTNPYQNYKNKTAPSALGEIKRTDPVFVRAEAFKIRKKEVHPFVQMMRNPDGFKNAVVMSEIINTKYF